jgi:hypothetical protein
MYGSLLILAKKGYERERELFFNCWKKLVVGEREPELG